MADSNFNYQAGKLNQADEFAATGATLSINPYTNKNELVIKGDGKERGPIGALNPAYVYISPDGINFDVDTDLDRILNLYYADFRKDPAYKDTVYKNLKIKKGANPTDVGNALNKRIVDFLTEVTGLPPSKVKSKLLPPSDVYLTAQELIEYGVADHIL